MASAEERPDGCILIKRGVIFILNIKQFGCLKEPKRRPWPVTQFSFGIGICFVDRWYRFDAVAEGLESS